MNPARARRANARLLHLDVARAAVTDRKASELPALLEPGDVLVVNDAATLPASLQGRVQGVPDGAPGASIELRLFGQEPDGSWRAVLFGAGDWRTPTELRPAPPRLEPGTTLELGELRARIEEWLAPSPRLVRVRFDTEGARFWSALYRAGRPVQYSYLQAPLELWDVMTSYAGRPWAAEAPSAGYPLDAAQLLALRARGVELIALTHAAGLSATGDPALDAALPLAERFSLPERSVSALRDARRAGRRVVAVGTTVVRALEGNALQHGGQLSAGEGSTTLRLGPGYRRQVVDALLTGMHDPTESHYALLQTFAPRTLLDRAHAQAQSWGYLGHEFGDACLIV
ncbi:MAG TPA: S-adenosylmethionine:tRNA ribosyltransferase-isomerase [Polyangiaceae bacterium]|nr:S-adenosylmethionine:tRNA ribosyltransferase-isomerase [Polyangiaceae bacterium]